MRRALVEKGNKNKSTITIICSKFTKSMKSKGSNNYDDTGKLSTIVELVANAIIQLINAMIQAFNTYPTKNCDVWGMFTN